MARADRVTGPYVTMAQARGLLPENTLTGFARALEIGVTTLELDCGLTKDGVVVIAHDRALNPDFTRDSGGRSSNWGSRGRPWTR